MLVYITFEDETKDKVRDEETENRLTIKGKADDPKRHEFIMEIFRKLACETLSEKVQRKVSIINEILQ